MEDRTIEIDGIVCDGFEGTTPTVTRGSTVSMTVGLHDRSIAARPYYERYEDLRAYLAIDGGSAVRHGQTDTGEPWFRERLPGSASVDTLLVDVTPGEDVVDVEGFWAIILGGEDQSVPVTSLRRLDLELFVVAPLDAYADKAAVRNAHESEVI